TRKSEWLNEIVAYLISDAFYAVVAVCTANDYLQRGNIATLGADVFLNRSKKIKTAHFLHFHIDEQDVWAEPAYLTQSRVRVRASETYPHPQRQTDVIDERSNRLRIIIQDHAIQYLFVLFHIVWCLMYSLSDVLSALFR